MATMQTKGSRPSWEQDYLKKGRPRNRKKRSTTWPKSNTCGKLPRSIKQYSEEELEDLFEKSDFENKKRYSEKIWDDPDW